MFPVAEERKRSERRTIEAGTAIWRAKKLTEREATLSERKEMRDMLAAYNPWGRPGHGAPVPGSLRKTKWTLHEAVDAAVSPSGAMALGRPGHGAPLRTVSGKIKALLRSDPSIHFQSHEPSRRSVENELRYRASPKDKENYRKELDAMLVEKRRNAEEPEKSKGWTDEVTFRRLVRSLPKGDREEIRGGGGVELVPLLAKNRMVNRSPLSSTDVTRISKILNGPMEATPRTDVDYQRQLSRQINEKQQMMQEERREDLETSQKHFETWKGFWGRPGHGAPKALSQREKLDRILYHVPLRRN